jgi:hypothetical protein
MFSTISGGIAEDVLGRCVPRGKQGGSKLVAFGREGVTVGSRDFADEAVSAQQADAPAAAACNLAAAFRGEVAAYGVGRTRVGYPRRPGHRRGHRIRASSLRSICAPQHQSEASVLASLPTESASVEDLLAAAEDEVRLRGCVQGLGDTQRTVATLRMLDETDGENVARTLGRRTGRCCSTAPRPTCWPA